MRIYDCKVNHLDFPLGYDLGSPAFSWKLEAQGTQQALFDLTICLDEAMTQTVWSSGLTQLDPLCTQPPLTLAPRTRYYWQVTARLGDETVTGDLRWFETAKLAEPWQARWITCDRSQPRHPVFSRELPVRGPVKRARLYICGLGLYEASIDGRRIGSELFAPHCNDYNSWVQYQTYDITDLLRPGAKLSVLLGNGWYGGRFGFDKKLNNAPFFEDAWKLLAEVRIDYADGTCDVVGTDESWQVHRSNITFSNIYDGEQVDANLADTAPVPAQLSQPPRGQLQQRKSVPVTVHEELPVREIIHTPAGETVLDLGQNLAGIFRMRVCIPAGQKLHLQFGEILQQGNFYRGNLRDAKAEYIWISDGAEHVLQPKFTFFGYRYVKVTGAAPEQFTFTALAVYSHIPAIGSLSTGHGLVNQLISNTMWGQKGNFLDVPTDCPQRDERMGWTGDAQVFAPTACYLTDCAAFYEKYLTDMNHEQRRQNGGVPVVIPSVGTILFATAWGDAATVIPWTVYRFTGDKAFLERHFEGMTGWTDFCTREYEKGTWLTQFHYGDWLALDGPEQESKTRGGTDEGFIALAYLIRSSDLTAAAARVLGQDELARQYEALSCRLRADLHREYFSPTGRCCVDTQTAHTLILAFDLHPNRQRAAQGLRDRLAWSGGKLQTGFVGTPILCPTLSSLGLSEDAYKLLLHQAPPGWLYAVKMGATTIWERWDSVLPDGTISPKSMNSLNHYSYGSILEWMWSWCAGLEIAAPGMRQVRLHPVVSRELGHLDAVYESASGRYEVHWSFQGDNGLRLSVTVPYGCQAELTLPHAPESAYTHGRTLTCGTYEFSYEMV